MNDLIDWLKLWLAAVGAGLVSIGQSIEPSEAVWVMAVAGGMLGVALGEDRSVRTIVIHAALGIAVGVAGANMAEILVHAPRAPSALGVGLFAARMTVAVNKQIDEGKINPFSWFRKGP
jgi:hypothetical protein